MKKGEYGYWNRFHEDWTDMRKRHWASYWKEQFQGVTSLFGVVSIVFMFAGPYLPKAMIIAGFVSMGLFILSYAIQSIFKSIEYSTYQ